MLYVYTYTDNSCPACLEIKQILLKHNMEFTLIPVKRGLHPFKTVPQVFFNNGDYVGDKSAVKSLFINK